MQTIQELGEAVSARRRLMSPRQAAVAQQAGSTAESLSRFERARSAELGAGKLLAVLAVLAVLAEMGIEFDVLVSGQSGTLHELRRERHNASAAKSVGQP